MKKIILIVTVATMIAGVVFVACQKETTKTDKKEVIKQGVKQQKEMSHWGLNWKWDASVGECLDLYPRDCFDEVIIRPEQRISYREFIQEVTLSSDAVANVFSDDNRFREILPNLEGEILDLLRDGSFYMHHVVNEEINKEFLIATKEDAYTPEVEVFAVFPFKIIEVEEYVVE